jgi:hypothetical protein
MNEDRKTHGHGLVGGDTSRPAQGHSGEAADLAADRVEDCDLDSMDRKERQDVLVDEAVEETYPASDPISPKRIT